MRTGRGGRGNQAHANAPLGNSGRFGGRGKGKNGHQKGARKGWQRGQDGVAPAAEGEWFDEGARTGWQRGQDGVAPIAEGEWPDKGARKGRQRGQDGVAHVAEGEWFDNRINNLCRSLATSGVTQQAALEAVARLWPAPLQSPGRRLRINDAFYVVEENHPLLEESGYFERLFGGSFREGEEYVVDVSEVPVLRDDPDSFALFLSFAEHRGNMDLCGLGRDHLSSALGLLLLSDYFEAPRLVERLLAHVGAHCAMVITSSPSHRDSKDIFRKLPFHLLERILASVDSKTEVLHLCGVWCDSEATDDLAEYLQRRCTNFDGIDFKDMMKICGSYPCLLSRLPRHHYTTFFYQVLDEMCSLQAEFRLLLRMSLPQTASCHAGTYTQYDCHSGTGGWSCCQERRIRAAGCSTCLSQGKRLPQYAPRLVWLRNIFDFKDLQYTMDTHVQELKTFLEECPAFINSCSKRAFCS